MQIFGLWACLLEFRPKGGTLGKWSKMQKFVNIANRDTKLFSLRVKNFTVTHEQICELEITFKPMFYSLLTKNKLINIKNINEMNTIIHKLHQSD